MNVNRLLNILEGRQLQLVLYRGHPRIRGPQELITDELREVIKFHREELLPFCKAVEPNRKPKPRAPEPWDEVSRPPEPEPTGSPWVTYQRAEPVDLKPFTLVFSDFVIRETAEAIDVLVKR